MSSKSADLTLNEFAITSDQEWAQAAEESLKGAPLSKLGTKTPEGIALKPIYTVADIAGLAETYAGAAPFVRGASAVGKAPWVAQEIPCKDPKQFNVAAIEALMRGQNSLQLCFCSKGGNGPQTLADAKIALAGIVPSAIELLICGGCSPLPALGMFSSLSNEWRGAIYGDPISKAARKGMLPPTVLLEEMAVAVKWSLANGERLRTVGVNGRQWAEAGGTAVEELAFALAAAVEYLRELDKRGVSPAQAAGQFLFIVSLGSNIFMQISKIRALRAMWSRVLAACGVAEVPAFIHAQGTLFNKSKLDPYTNMLRATTEAFAGTIGGADSIHVSAFDEVVRKPGDFSRRVARNVQTILAEECHFADVADAAGGSYFVESETAELAKKAWGLFQQVEAKGGMLAALREGFPQQTVETVCAARIKAVGSRRDAFIGVNLFPNLAEKPLDAAAGCSCTAPATPAADWSAANFQPTVDGAQSAFEAGATYPQVKEAFNRGPREKIAAIVPRRLAEGFEVLREKAAGKSPVVWLANFGNAKQHKARADFSAGFFAAGGFTVKQSKGAASVEDALRAASEAAAAVVVICSTDDTYPEIVPAFAVGLKAACPDTFLVVAGNPTEHIAAFQTAGVDDFIHLKVNCQEFLTTLQSRLGL